MRVRSCVILLLVVLLPDDHHHATCDHLQSAFNAPLPCRLIHEVSYSNKKVCSTALTHEISAPRWPVPSPAAVLRTSRRKRLVCTGQETDTSPEALWQRLPADLLACLRFSRVLGQGSFGTVVLAEKRSDVDPERELWTDNCDITGNELGWFDRNSPHRARMSL